MYFHYFHPDDFNYLIPVLSAFGSFLTGIAAIVLAWWAGRKYFREREHETKLSIELSIINYKSNGINNVFIDVHLQNTGNVPVRSYNRYIRRKDGKLEEMEFAYRDEIETIKYSIELQIKKVKLNHVIYNWFDSQHYETFIEPINLLTDLEAPAKFGDPVFYLEPKDSQHLGCFLALFNGLYEAKVIFIGERKEEDFWTCRKPFIIEGD